jgi:hypothetical protein
LTHVKGLLYYYLNGRETNNQEGSKMDKSVKAAKKMYDWALALHIEKRTSQSLSLLEKSEAKLNKALTKLTDKAA